MKKLDVKQMENLQGGWKLTDRDKGCFFAGLAAGVAAGMNPLVGGLTGLACFYLN
ncbi:MAG: hypothetical protein Q4G16_04765 [Cruoricaptor ignavus]|nr:hypothetical protein [Cruoricaptor ignavus]